jgi:hypothetical protein
MGQSTDAILMYGVCIEEGSNIHEYIEEEGNELYDMQFDGTKDGDVVIETHCSCDYPMYFIGYESTRTLASRGYPKSVDPTQPVDSAELKAFLAKHNIDDSNMGWHLFSMWC